MEASKLWPVWPEAVDRPLEPGQQMLKDVLDGLTVLYENTLIRDIRNTVLAYPDSSIGIALNKKQTACKKWLVENVYSELGADLGRVHVLAGWYGVIGAMLLNDPRFNISCLTNIDIDPSCEAVALSLNATSAAAGRFRFHVGDIYELEYGTSKDSLEQPDLLINTSCEHMDRFADWFASIPDGTMMALQSNDYLSIPEHVNCVRNVEEFKAQAPMKQHLYAGSLDVGKYTRYMLIGRK